MREISCGNFGLEKMGEITKNETVKIYGLNNNFNWNGYNITEMQKLYCLIDLLRLYEDETYDENNTEFIKKLYENLKKLLKTKNNVNLYVSKTFPHIFSDEENSVLEILNINEEASENEIISLFDNIIFNKNICVVHVDDLYFHRIEIKEMNKDTYKKIPLNSTINVGDDFYRCLNKAVQEETNSNLKFDYQSDFRYMDDYGNNIFDILDFNSSDDEDEIIKHFKNIIFDDNFFILYNIEY